LGTLPTPQPLGVVVEHQERGLAAAARGYQIHDGLVAEQVVVDVLDRLERLVWRVVWDQHVRVPGIEAVDVVDAGEPVHPLVHAEDVEVRRADEVDRLFVPDEVIANVGQPA
jgi:hypothetical protein